MAKDSISSLLVEDDSSFGAQEVQGYIVELKTMDEAGPSLNVKPQSPKLRVSWTSYIRLMSSKDAGGSFRR
jgi:hypothetical protein